MLLIPESVRWLAKKGRYVEARKNLIWVRGGEETEEVKEEFDEILYVSLPIALKSFCFSTIVFNDQ